jgi:hypothetical protein
MHFASFGVLRARPPVENRGARNKTIDFKKVFKPNRWGALMFSILYILLHKRKRHCVAKLY